jgi:2,4-dienoyl-CoA reductase-like NADH-dependent reductase (Old Yellow Enzyme family)/thioredoxin reductase
MEIKNMKFTYLTRPLRVRNIVLRNRMLSTASTPHFLQGTEDGPTEKIITHFEKRARSGAAAVSINHFHKDRIPFDGRAIDNPPAHFNLYDLEDGNAQNYICQLIDAIHFHGSKATAYIMPDPSWFFPGGSLPPGNDLSPPFPPPSDIPQSSETEQRVTGADGGPPQPEASSISKEMIAHFIANLTREALDLKRLGFDIISLYCCYRNSPPALFLSPFKNDRKDEYGGSVENRSRFLLDLCRSLRQAVGDTPIEVVYSVSEPEGGYTVEDTIAFTRLADGLIDILHLRAGEMDPQHPLGYTSKEDSPMPYLNEMGRVCKAVHEAGLSMAVGVSAGFFDPVLAERALAEGKADLICMARSWISNVDYGRKVLEGHDDEIVPCVRCNKCHVANVQDMWRSVCTVNPRLGFEDKLDRMIVPPAPPLSVAVVGGGPAGMEFALESCARGYDVTLYESEDRLGGQLLHADYPSFKWPLRQFRDFLAAKTMAGGIHVFLGTEATPDLLSAEGYDVIAVAAGTKPTRIPLPVADASNVYFASRIYGRDESALGNQVVVIGGGDIGVETALYLCELGKSVMVLEMLPELLADAPKAHYKNMVRDYWMKQPNFRYKCGVRCTAIDADGVNYTTYDGKQEKALCDSVLLAVGTKSRVETVMAFAQCAPRVIAIGDCDRVGNVQTAMRSAFGAAMSL